MSTESPAAFEVIAPEHGRFSIIHTESREEWLAARQAHITATEVATLAALRPADWDRLRREKAGEAPAFKGNAATDWGHDREPFILDFIAQEVDPTVRPNDQLVVSIADPRFAGTPDGISGDGRVIAEAKTSGSPMAPEDRPQQYEDQIQWNLLVTGADVAILAVEEHHDREEIVGIRTAEVWPDPERQAFLVGVAERFLSGGDAVPATDDAVLASAIDEWAALKEQEKRLKAALKEREAALRDLIGDGAGTWSSPTWQVKQTAATSRERIDVKAVAADFPEVAEKCTVTSITRGRLLAPTRVKGAA